MNLHEHIDLYCERVDESFFSEPINALTNFAFIISAFLIFRFYKKNNLDSIPLLFLTFLLSLIGVGSFLFHTFATTWSEFADTIPIWSFVVFYIMFSSRIVFENSWFKTARITIIVFIFAYIGLNLSHTDGSSDEVILNGSIQYAPALFFMIVYAVALYLKKGEYSKYAFYAVGIFLISLTFRTADMEVCGSFALGTHFLWHILNAVMLYYLLYIIALAVKKGY